MNGLISLSLIPCPLEGKRDYIIFHIRMQRMICLPFLTGSRQISRKQNRDGMVFTQFALHFITELILCKGLPHPVTHHLVTEITLETFVYRFFFFFSVSSELGSRKTKPCKRKEKQNCLSVFILTTSLSLANLEQMAFHSILSFAPHAQPMNNILPDIFLKCLSDPCLAFLPAPTSPIPLPGARWASNPGSPILAPSLSPVTGMSLGNFH